LFIFLDGPSSVQKKEDKLMKLFSGMEQLFNQQAMMNNMIQQQQQQNQLFQERIMLQQQQNIPNDLVGDPTGQPDQEENLEAPIVTEDIIAKFSNKNFSLSSLLVSFILFD